MPNRTKLLLAGITATLLLSLAIETTSANRLRTSHRTFRLTWSLFIFNPSSVECPLTLEGSFHSSTFAKVSGALYRHITRAFVYSPGCVGGRATVLQETLPWHIRYRGFTGTLPVISGLNSDVVGMSIKAELPLFGITCLVRTTAERPWTFREGVGAGGAITSISGLSEASIPFAGACAPLGTASFVGSGRVTEQGTSATLTLSLI